MCVQGMGIEVCTYVLCVQGMGVEVCTVCTRDGSRGVYCVYKG